MNGKRIIALVLCALMAFSLAGCNSSDYKTALSLAQSGDYEGARNLFTSLADYKDAAAKVTECDYHLALNAMAASDYDKAIALLESLGSYEDATQQLTECRYLKAKSLLENGDFAGAEALFTELGDYKDSAEQVKECKYQNALALYEAEDYENALVLIGELNKDYKDTGRYNILCALQSDENRFIDDFAKSVSAYFAEKGLEHTLIEDELPESWTERDFYVNHLPADSEEKDTDGIALAFNHVNGKGTTNAKGNINHILTTGYVYPASMIDQVYSDFLDTASVMMCVLDYGTDYEEMRSLADAKITALKEQVGTEEGRVYEEFEYNGYNCLVVLASYYDVKQYYFTVGIPELVND